MNVESSMDYGRHRRSGKLMIKNKTLGGSDAPNISASYRRRTLRVQSGKLRPHVAGRVCTYVCVYAHI